MTNQNIRISDLKENCIHHIVYVGLERGDLIIALARTAAAAGLKVAVADLSITHDLYEAYKDGIDDGIVERGNVTIAKNRVLSDASECDIYIEYIGLRDIPIDKKVEYLITACTPNRQVIERVARTLSVEYDTRFILLRDYDGKYTVKDICHDMKVTDKTLISTVRADLKEISNYDYFTRNNAIKLVKVFTASAPVFFSIASDVIKMPEKQLSKVIKKNRI